MAKIIPYNENSIDLASNILKKGKIVAFPTETVYGLGANALNKDAVEKIFIAKKRPKSDPLIVHVKNYESIIQVTDMTGFQHDCLKILANKFFPGPLTLIVKSSPKIPKIVTSDSDFIGVRIPNHTIALHLLEKCDLPLAAPSANTFGHVSPTSAEHVKNDLDGSEDLLILDSHIPCKIGIESTILKIIDNKNIILLRPGAISTIDIENELKFNGINTSIINKKKNYSVFEKDMVESPGQFLTHYSPSIETFILSNENEKADQIKDNVLSNSVLIDFNSKYKFLKEKTKGYFDLSVQGFYEHASYNLFSFLREAEKINEAKYILLPDFSFQKENIAQALYDRIYRAASGKFISYSD